MKVLIREDGKNWVALKISHQGEEEEIYASEITCTPLSDLILAIENCCIYSQNSSFIWDAEGVEYKLEFKLVESGIAISISFIKAKNIELIFKSTCDQTTFIMSFWRGLKSYLAGTAALRELSVIEKYIKAIKS